MGDSVSREIIRKYEFERTVNDVNGRHYKKPKTFLAFHVILTTVSFVLCCVVLCCVVLCCVVLCCVVLCCVVLCCLLIRLFVFFILIV